MQPIKVFPLAHSQIGGSNPKIRTPELVGQWSLVDGRLILNSDAALSIFEEPRIGVDLMTGYDDWKGEDDAQLSAASIETILKCAPKQLAEKSTFLTFRHNLILIAKCPYESQVTSNL